MAAGHNSMMASAMPELVDAAEGLGVFDAGERCGLGVHTLVARTAHEAIHQFNGIIGPELSQHTLQVGPGRHISGTRIIGYLSHSCDPNCRLDMDRFELVTLRDTPAGDALTIDYAVTEAGMALLGPYFLDYQVNGRPTRRPGVPPGNHSEWPAVARVEWWAARR